jgi:5-methyltetrahydropteroyltriglutamate--homocysteine methyltransferase
MLENAGRIRTTHTGSLPRPPRLANLLMRREMGEQVGQSQMDIEVAVAVQGIVDKQRELGIDVIDDGEQSKLGFVAYVNERLSGFQYLSSKPAASWSGTRESAAFPDFYDSNDSRGSMRVRRLVCTGPIAYVGQRDLARDLDNLRTATAGRSDTAAFVPAASPASIEGWQSNVYYKSDTDYLEAIANAMREEYRAIVDAGFLLQVDDPRIAMHWTLNPQATLEGLERWARLRIDALNYALDGIPAEKVRYHTCYGINMGPRETEIGMPQIANLMLSVNAGFYSFEAANPRHEHEWRMWQDVKLPDGKIVIPGMVSHTTVLVEHPRLVADRILRFASLVGRERVIAGTDCGFATNPMDKPEVATSIVWAKLRALTEGAQIASRELWS